ncbi:MAG: flagellar biosynthesis protein FlhB [Ignavibacteriae bacterium]|nr:flagellar biosynthesis protein FlhB [Ignavibacteriota bacterium]
MAEFESAEERTEPASGKKRGEARKRGSVAKSMDLNSAAVLLFGLLILYVGGSSIAVKLGELARSTFANLGSTTITQASVHNMIREGVLSFTIIVLPVLAGLMVVGLIANIAQVGFMFTMQPMAPKFSKLNPFTGIKRVMISMNSLLELLKGLVKVTVVALVAYSATNDVVSESMILVDSDVGTILEFMAKVAAVVSLKVGLAFFVIAAGDYMFQRYQFEKSLRMTKQEVKEEGKEAEGDPQIKGRIRTVQRQIAYRRMMQDVPKADVVVTNPTHYAVAIKYEAGRMSAPKVVAKGVDIIAQRIKEIAREHQVPIVEDKPLAQMLYKSVEIGDEIPEKLFQAVAQLLAYVFRLRDARRSHVSVN